MKYTGERQVATTLDQVRPDHVGRYQHTALLVDGLRVLDAACGCGYGSHILSKKADHVVGIDINLEAVAHASSYWQGENIDFVADDATKHFGEFDVVVSFETIEHIKNPEPLLRSFADQAPTLIASVPNEDVLPFNKNKFPFHFRHYTPGEFEELLNKCGWRVTDKYSNVCYSLPDLEVGTKGRTIIFHCERV